MRHALVRAPAALAARMHCTSMIMALMSLSVTLLVPAEGDARPCNLGWLPHALQALDFSSRAPVEPCLCCWCAPLWRWLLECPTSVFHFSSLALVCLPTLLVLGFKRC